MRSSYPTKTRAWPRCRSPVMFGSGSIITNGFLGLVGSGVKKPERSHHSWRSRSTAAGRKFFSASSSADAGGPGIVFAIADLLLVFAKTKTPPRPRTSGVVVPPWLRTEMFSPCLMSPVTGGPDPARGRPSEPLAWRPFTRRAPSLSVRGSYSSRSRPVAKQDNEDREKNDGRRKGHQRRGSLRRRGRQGRGTVRREGRGLVARHRRDDRSGRSRARRFGPAEVA